MFESRLADESVELPKADRPTEERDTVMACRKKKKKTESKMEYEGTNQLPEERSIDLPNEPHNKRKKKKKGKKETEIQDMEEQSPVLADEKIFKKEKKEKRQASGCL